MRASQIKRLHGDDTMLWQGFEGFKGIGQFFVRVFIIFMLRLAYCAESFLAFDVAQNLANLAESTSQAPIPA